MYPGCEKHFPWEIQVSANNNGLLQEEKTIKRIDLQRVASVSKNKGITIEQYIEGNQSFSHGIEKIHPHQRTYI